MTESNSAKGCERICNSHFLNSTLRPCVPRGPQKAKVVGLGTKLPGAVEQRVRRGSG